MTETSSTLKEKYSFAWWSDQIKRAKKEREQLIETANQSDNLYKKEYQLEDCERTIGIWWSLVNTLIPAYFSKVPKVDVQLRKKRGNELYRLTALAFENSTQYTIEEHFDFTSVGYLSVLQFLIAGEGVLWARKEADFEDKPYEYPLLKGEDGSYQDEEGKPYQNDKVEISEREGRIYAKEIVPTKTKEKAILDAVHYKNFLTSVARSDSEVIWKARESFLSREQAKQLFPNDYEDFSYNSYPEDKTKPEESRPTYEGKAQMYEIWCKESGKVYYLHRGSSKKDFLEESDPPIKFHGFYPCIELKANIELNSNIPFSDYKIAKDLILEVERITTRIHFTLQAIRANFIYDSALGDKVEELLEGDLKGIPVTQGAATRLRGGLAGSIEFNNVEPYIKSLEVLTSSREVALNKLYEITAASDLLRSNSAPQKTATANELEASFANLRFIVRREQVAQFLTGGIKKIAEIIPTFSDETIFDMSFGEELAAEIPDPQPPPMPPQQPGQPPMPMPPMPPPLSPEQKFQAIIEVMRDKDLSSFKIDIESDSIVELDQKAERAERIDMLQSAGAFLTQAQGMIELFPESAEFVGDMLQFAIRSYKAGKELEGKVMETFQAIAQQAKAKAQNQDDGGKGAEIQGKMQIEQIKAQTAQAKINADLQKTQMQVGVEQQAQGVEVQISNTTAQIKQLEAQVKLAQLNLELETLRFEAAKIQSEELKAGVELAQGDRQIEANLIKETMDTEQELIKLKAKTQKSIGG